MSEVCQNVVLRVFLTKLDTTMTTIKKKPNFAQSRPATKYPTPGT